MKKEIAFLDTTAHHQNGAQQTEVNFVSINFKKDQNGQTCAIDSLIRIPLQATDQNHMQISNRIVTFFEKINPPNQNVRMVYEFQNPSKTGLMIRVSA